MYSRQGFHHFTSSFIYCLIVCAILLFSSCHGRPKDAEVRDMQIQVSAPDQVQPPTFGVKDEGEENQRTGRDQPPTFGVRDDGEENQKTGEDDVPEARAGSEEDVPYETPVINVHDMRSRAMVDYMKQMPYQGGDVEEIMHGGNHVHGEEHDGPKKDIGVGGGAGLGDLVGGVKEEEEDLGAPSTFDTEELMHGDGTGHGHNPHKGGKKEEHGPTAENPEDLLHIRDIEHQAEELNKRDPGAVNPEEMVHKMDAGRHKARTDDEKEEHKQDVGVPIEQVVHGDAHAHGHHEVEVTEEYEDEDGVTRKRKVGKQITAEDIENLGLSKEDLEGIDLSKLLRRDQSEYDTWKQDQLEEKDKGFWERVDEFRSNYFNMLSKKIRHFSRFNDDDDDNQPQWEDDDDDNDVNSPHPGESQVDHDSEMWGSTKPKKGTRLRRTFTVIKRQTHDGTEEL